MNSIFHRISVRKYEDKPVEKEKIMEILKAGMHRVQNGKIFRMILNAPYVLLAKTSFLWLSKEAQQNL